MCFSDTMSGIEQNDNIIITADDIKAMNAQKMTDVLNHVPGVTAGDTSVGIHGSYKVKVFVDGRPINDPTSSYGAVNWDLISLENVERIEILRGKGGMRYGQDASGGVILVTTQKVSELSGKVKFYSGNYHTGYGYANVQMQSGKWTIGGSSGCETTKGYKINNDKDRYQVGTKIGYSVDERKRFFFLADYIEEERGSSGLPEHPTPFYRKSSNNTNLSFLANLNTISSTAFFNEGSNCNTDNSRGLNHQIRVREWGEDVSTILENQWGNMNCGARYKVGQFSSNQFDDESENTVSAFLAQAFQWPSQSLSLNIGLRLNVNSAFDDAINPEIKIVYPTDKWRITAGYSRSNNTPSFYQRFNQTSSTLPNPDLEMEVSDNFNLELFMEPFHQLSCSISFFHNRLNDRITYITENTGMGQYHNFGRVTYTGADLAISWQIHQTIKIKSDYTYLEAVDENTGLWLPAKAKHTVNVNVYCTPSQYLSAVLSSKYVSSVYRNKSNTKTMPEYTLMDIKTEYRVERFSLFGEVTNLFDKTYYYADGLLAKPRLWIAGVNFRI
ncbi:MAG: TonB-dependent receptor [Candidatus Magnetoglobus multicellularis str. Araruama]|uniref:TonB-dependent receptor n=1 Tax=Candidatus Magnetoglobus multicellularis str. Araruama TaxID=890399 RepID=A0A1V1PCT7_9BACT|nr:MAG: TonB-dependent receptor [Candidatus Magnetoglobus multicellularis str. Araruama]